MIAKPKKMHKCNGEMIAIELQSFSVVEDLGFKRLSSQVYKRKYCARYTQKVVRNKIQKKINIATHLSLTSDGLTASSANLSFLSLSSHQITANFEQESTVVKITPLKVSHTAINISECITDSMAI